MCVPSVFSITDVLGLAQSLNTNIVIIQTKNRAVCQSFRLAGGGSGNCITAAVRVSSSLRKITAMNRPIITAKTTEPIIRAMPKS